MTNDFLVFNFLSTATYLYLVTHTYLLRSQLFTMRIQKLPGYTPLSQTGGWKVSYLLGLYMSSFTMESMI